MPVLWDIKACETIIHRDKLTEVIETFHTVNYGYTSMGMACQLITADIFEDRPALFSPRIFQYIYHPETNEWILFTAFFFLLIFGAIKSPVQSVARKASLWAFLDMLSSRTSKVTN